MKPHRIRVTHELVTAYDMLDKMHVLVWIHLALHGRLIKMAAETKTRVAREDELLPHGRVCPFSE